MIYKQQNEKRIEIARAPFDYLIDHTYELEFAVKADNLIMKIDGNIVVKGKDSELDILLNFTYLASILQGDMEMGRHILACQTNSINVSCSQVNEMMVLKFADYSG